MEEPTRRPEAELIETLRLAQQPKMSVLKAAKGAAISEGRWRQIAKGYQQATKDARIPVVAPADTLARMARVVGATPDQLREAGRADAADELEELLRKGVEFEAVRQKLGDIYDTVQRRPSTTRIKLPDATPVDLLILARDTPADERTEQQWQLVYEAEERLARLERSMAAVTEELLHQRQNERGGNRAAPTDTSSQSDAPSEAREVKEVSVNERQYGTGGIHRDVGSRKHPRVDRTEDGEKRQNLSGQ